MRCMFTLSGSYMDRSGQIRAGPGRAGVGFSLLTFEQVLKRYKVLSRLQEKDPDVQLLNEILVMEKSKKTVIWYIPTKKYVVDKIKVLEENNLGRIMS